MNQSNTQKIFILIFFIFVCVDNLYVYPADDFLKIPTLTSQNFDNRISKLKIQYVKNGKEVIEDVGTGVFMHKEDNLYLVSAGHVFKGALKKLLDNDGVMIIYGKFLSKKDNKLKIGSYPLDVVEYFKKGKLKFNRDKTVDIGIINLGKIDSEQEEKVSEEKTKGQNDKMESGDSNTEEIVEERVKDKQEFIVSAVGLPTKNNDQYIQYGDVEKAEDVYFFGFPDLPTLTKMDKVHTYDPIIRKGIVSKLIDGKKIIIDGFVSGGNSGSPVFIRREFVKQSGYQIHFRFIGIVTQFLPYILPTGGSQIDNSSLGLVESVDNIINTLEEFNLEKKIR